MNVASTPEIIAELKAGRMVILVDEEDRENEGDLILAADFVTAETINFMARYGRGLICLTLTEERCRRLRLAPMVSNNGTVHGTAFTASIEAAEGVTTGISAADRARTVQAAVAPDARAEDLVQPGHIFPLMARPGGVLVRAGHTEAGCDLAQLAGLSPAAVICEILKDDGTMARLPDLLEFGQQHGLRIGTIADLIQYRSATESLVERMGERPVHTAAGEFRLIAYRDKPSHSAHFALVRGTPDATRETLVRVHEPVTAIDLLDLRSPSHSWPVHAALKRIAHEGEGVVVLLNCGQPPEMQLGSALEDVTSAQQTAGGDGPSADQTPPARRRRSQAIDLRTYGLGAQILKDIGVGRMRLLSPPLKMPSMIGFDLEVVGFEARPAEE